MSNNIKALQNSLKMIKVMEYLKNNLGSNGFLLLQETYSSLADEKNWGDELKQPMIFLHGKTSYCAVAIGCIGNNKINILDKKVIKMDII